MRALVTLINPICNINFDNARNSFTTAFVRLEKEDVVKKSLVLSLASLVIGISACTHSAKAQQSEKAGPTQATFYRAWQGYLGAGVSTEHFKTEFPAFMKQTVDLYKEKLNNYIVVIPP